MNKVGSERDAEVSTPVGRSIYRTAIDRLFQSRAAVAALVFLALMTLVCAFGPMLSPHPFDRVYPNYVRTAPSLAPHPSNEDVANAIDRIAARMHATVSALQIAGNVARFTLQSAHPIDPRSLAYFERSDVFASPTIAARDPDGTRLNLLVAIQRVVFPFGTDANGRDLMTRTLVAGRVSLLVGLLASSVALVIGVSWGAIAGYLGGRIDIVMMRVVDILYALPFIFFVILLIVFFGRNFVLIFVAIGAVEWLDMARIVRGQTLSIKRQEYVQAAEALGLSTGAILRRHIVPNSIGPIVVFLTMMVPRIILLESFLSFLGLGIQEPMTSWGVLIAEGARSIQGSTGMLLYPALFLTTTLFGLNFIGDRLRDAFDPKAH
jgi:oligopeptide transport system permease protein